MQARPRVHANFLDAGLFGNPRSLTLDLPGLAPMKRRGPRCLYMCSAKSKVPTRICWYPRCLSIMQEPAKPKRAKVRSAPVAGTALFCFILRPSMGWLVLDGLLEYLCWNTLVCLGWTLVASANPLGAAGASSCSCSFLSLWVLEAGLPKSFWSQSQA